MTNLPFLEIMTVALGGFLGSFIKDCLQDNAIELPYKKDGKIYLGFIGGALVGILVGIAIDGSFVTAAMAGYSGTAVLRQLLSKENLNLRNLNQQDKDTLMEKKIIDLKTLQIKKVSGSNKEMQKQK
jgi:hypothetical protein